MGEKYNQFIESALTVVGSIDQKLSKLTADQDKTFEIQAGVRMLLKVIIDQQTEIAYIIGMNKGGEDKNTDTETFAEAAKARTKVKEPIWPERDKPAPTPTVVIVNPVAAGTSTKTKQDMIASLDIKTANIKIKNCRPIRNGGVLVELNNEEDADKFLTEFRSKEKIKAEYTVKKTN